MAGTVLIIQGADAALEIVEMALFESEAVEIVDAGMSGERLEEPFASGVAAHQPRAAGIDGVRMMKQDGVLEFSTFFYHRAERLVAGLIPGPWIPGLVKTGAARR
jgi:hypothetical protein